MGFESQGGESGIRISPGGFEFGTVGWHYPDPVPKSITWFLDGSALVSDQSGRVVCRAILPDGSEVRFADRPPEGNRDGEVIPRPEFATHAQVIAALVAERIDWLSYEVRYQTKDGAKRAKSGLTMPEAVKVQARLILEGNRMVTMGRTIESAGWPQLPYAELMKLPSLPPTPLEELRKIRNPELRRDALRARREADAERAKEMQVAEAE